MVRGQREASLSVATDHPTISNRQHGTNKFRDRLLPSRAMKVGTKPHCKTRDVNVWVHYQGMNLILKKIEQTALDSNCLFLGSRLARQGPV